MINDKDLIFSDGQNCFVTDNEVNSTNDVDVGVADPNQGAGAGKKVVHVEVNTAITGGTSIQIIVRDSADDATYNDLYMGPAIAIGALTAVGKTLLNLPLPPTHRRYLRVVYKCVGAVAAGKADAYLNLNN